VLVPVTASPIKRTSNQEHEMSAPDGDLVDRMAKKHAVSPAAVEVVLAALRSDGGRMAQPAMPISAGCRSGRRACRWSATCSTPNSRPNWTPCAATSRHIWPLPRLPRYAIRCGRCELPFSVGIGGLVAGGIGQAGRRRRAERSPIRRFSRDPPAGDRRPGRGHSLRYRISPDPRRRAGPEQRSNPLLHEPGRVGPGRRPVESCRLTPAARHYAPAFKNLIPEGGDPHEFNFVVHGGCGGV
jgi:hypothetical protein